MNLNLPYCIYRTTHPSGFVYEGKGRTAKVLAGQYKGSGVRFKLALTVPGFEWDTWSTELLETFATEDEAYEAEAMLIPASKLRNPFQLNNQAGGRGGRHQNHSMLHRQDVAKEKKEARLRAAAKRKARDEVTRQKLAELRARIKK